MRRLFAVATALMLLLVLFAPAALAADGTAPGGRSLVLAVAGSVDVPAGDHLDGLVVVTTDARISGTVDSVVIVNGSAELTGATVGTLWVVDGSAALGPGTTVTGDVRTLHGTVSQAEGGVVQGSIRSLDGDLAALAVVMIPFVLLLMLGFGLAAIVAAVLVAALGARQTRHLESLISQEPGSVLVAGIAGTVLLPAVSILLMLTVIGAPLGFGLLFLVLPVLAFLAWIVAAIWIGDWLVGRMRGAPEPERPYLAAVLGVIVLSIMGLLPFVSALATLFGFGAILLAVWRTLRRDRTPAGEGQAFQPVPSAS